MTSPSRFSLAGAVRRAANTSARRPRTTIVLWLILVAACVLAGAMTGTRMLTGSESGTGESARADALMDRAGLREPAAETVLVRSDDAATTRAAVGALEARLRRVPAVSEVRTPALEAEGGRTALVELRLRGDPDDAAANVAPVETTVAAVGRAHPQATLAQAGAGTFENAFTDLLAQDFKRANTVSLPITLVILVIAFGAIVAASVPLLLGLTSVAAALGASALISQLVPSIESSSALVAVIGLAVGVDYSLFYIRREREERLAGKGPHAALDAAAATVGRAIVVSGVTVMVALAGLLLTGLSVFTSMALGTIVVVAIAVIGSVTVLPATLALLGDRVNKGRLPFLRRLRRRHAGRGVWATLARTVTRRPLAALVCAVCVLAALAVPALDMHAASSGLSALPADTPVLVAERAIERAFPGAPSDAELVISSHDLDTPAARERLRALGERARAITHGHGSISIDVSRDGRTAVVAVPMPDRGVDAAEQTVAQLRDRVGPEALVTGMAAGGADFTQRLASRTPLVIAAVLGLAMLLLFAAFRSPGLAAAVVGLNLLSVGAAYGVLVAVFQHEWAEPLLGFTSTGTIADWLPLFAFVILFGLSMDYTILVLERIREARLNGASAREAACEGVAATAGTVTSAAIVMVAVFAIFATMQFADNKQLGVGLSVAILLDATIVRGIALPAVVALLGERRWRVRPRGATTRGWDDGRPARVSTATAVVSSSRDAR
jgi:uncharacterized membrane protein YdfJ with MMPL/SSD domain